MPPRQRHHRNVLQLAFAEIGCDLDEQRFRISQLRTRFAQAVDKRLQPIRACSERSPGVLGEEMFTVK